MFLCPRYRAGLCDKLAGLRQQLNSFYALGIGLAFATALALAHAAPRHRPFLCPRYRAGLCDATSCSSGPAADVSMPSVSGWPLRPFTPWRRWRSASFLCPRYRAGLCDSGKAPGEDLFGHCFYALGIGLAFATGPHRGPPHGVLVSMPSVSGWPLRRMPCGGARGLVFWRRLRQPADGRALRTPFWRVVGWTAL